MTLWNPGKHRKLLVAIALAQALVVCATLGIGLTMTRSDDALVSAYNLGLRQVAITGGEALRAITTIDDRRMLTDAVAAARNRALLLMLAASGALSLGIILALWVYLARVHRHEQRMTADIAHARDHEARRALAEAEAARLRATRQQAEAAIQARVVHDITAGLERLAQGDLSGPIDSPEQDPFPAQYETLRASYNSVVDHLGHIVARIGAVADGVRDGSGEIDQAAQDLASRAETQAATLEQSAASLAQLTESVRAAAARSVEVEAATRDNHARAESGSRIVCAAIEAMKAIEDSSKQITRIIGTIDDIALQTNLLALNAGIEAARAGEGGRGFAVVAAEVRGLAQRAAASAQEIRELIAESAAHVENGSDLVRRTGDSLDEILGKAIDVQGLMTEIATSAQDQATGLDEINAGINQLDQVTQQNAAVAEETTAAASALRVNAADLVAILGHFAASNRLPAGRGMTFPAQPSAAECTRPALSVRQGPGRVPHRKARH